MAATMTRHGDTAMAANGERPIEGNRHVRALQPTHGQGRPSQSRPLPTFRGTGPTVALLMVCAVGLIPWTVGLAMTLPARDVVGSWTLTWAGFDIALVVCFAVRAWPSGINARSLYQRPSLPAPCCCPMPGSTC
jgi:hypothetical protein